MENCSRLYSKDENLSMLFRNDNDSSGNLANRGSLIHENQDVSIYYERDREETVNNLNNRGKVSSSSSIGMSSNSYKGNNNAGSLMPGLLAREASGSNMGSFSQFKQGLSTPLSLIIRMVPPN